MRKYMPITLEQVDRLVADVRTLPEKVLSPYGLCIKEKANAPSFRTAQGNARISMAETIIDECDRQVQPSENSYLSFGSNI